MKQSIYLLCLLCSSMAFSQGNYSDIVKPRLSFVSDKYEATDLQDYIALCVHDTLYAKYKTGLKLSSLNDSLFKDANFVGKYMNTFYYRNDKDKRYISQWSVPLVVHIDKKITKSTRENFETFFAQINNVENLNISFTSNIKKANYQIKVVDTVVNAYSKNYTFENETDRKNSFRTGATYKMLSDGNYKRFSGYLLINLEDKSEDLILKQLKQLFYMSLGQFTFSSKYNEDSIFSNKYDNRSQLIPDDLNILNLHYATIYDKKINQSTFKKIYLLINTK